MARGRGKDVEVGLCVCVAGVQPLKRHYMCTVVTGYWLREDAARMDGLVMCDPTALYERERVDGWCS